MAGRSYWNGEAIEVTVPTRHRAQLYSNVTNAVNDMAAAGVCHLDMRLSNNVFFRVEDEGCSSK